MSDNPNTPPLSLLERAFGAIVKALTGFFTGGSERYNPAKHYMRGPGPKWRAAHLAQANASAPGRKH